MENLTTENLIALVGGISAAITAVMMAFGKHVMPIVATWLGYKDREAKNSDKILKLETNHLVHIQADIDEIKKDVKGFSEKVDIIGNRVTRLETKLEK